MPNALPPSVTTQIMFLFKCFFMTTLSSFIFFYNIEPNNWNEILIFSIDSYKICKNLAKMIQYYMISIKVIGTNNQEKDI